ncbi:MAG TPA: VOC family protein [Solirubrobacteraceae bacterium]|jgi:catechol 2,3-dioxygenase-like lactoylglutathione lyase family enzyme|nr:VOC family protein [Solirubrobacteraceae bacterium]
MTAGVGRDAVALLGLHHLLLAMPAGREAQAREFYGGLLGLEELPKPAQLATRGGCWFQGNSLQLHLGVEEDFRPARKAHPAFEVRGLAALRERLEQAGVEVADDAPLGGYDRFYAFDPFGNRLELIEASR